MKIKIPILTAASLLQSINLQLSTCFAQGSLSPPGAPAATMKTLAQIEPRTPISALPFTISVAGSYYVTTNLAAVASVDGITVGADNVSVDLNGFSLTGFGTINSAVYSAAALKNLSIHNGIVRGWGAGINLGAASESKFENLQITENTANWGLLAGDNCQVLGCIVRSNLGGINLGINGAVKSCTAALNTGVGISTGDNSVLGECIAQANTGTGLAAGGNCTLARCTAAGNGSAGISCSLNCALADCAAAGNGGNGLSSGAGCSFGHCEASSNGFDGFGPSDSCTFDSCVAKYNAGTGFNTGSQCQLVACTANFNGSHGFFPYDHCTVRNCTASGSTNGYGISANYIAVVIEGCNVSNNKAGGINAGQASQVGKCLTHGNFGVGISAGDGSQIIGCVARTNTSRGIEVRAGASSIGSECLLKDCAASQNGDTGIRFSGPGVARDCTSCLNAGIGIECLASGGISGGSLISGCDASMNRSHGISAAFTSSIIGNNCYGNGYNGVSLGALAGYGIEITGSPAGRIEANSCQYNNRGIDCTASGAVIIKNNCGANTGAGAPSANYNLNLAGNDVGPIGTAAASTSPWANISF